MDLTKYYPDIVAKYPAYVTKRELCEICHICPKTAYNLEQQGEIPYTIEQNHLIRSHKIKLTDILAYLYRRECRQEADSPYICAMVTLCTQKYDMGDKTLYNLVTEAFPIVLFVKKLEDNSRRVMEITECEILEDGTRQLHTLYRYHVSETSIQDGKVKVHGEFQKVSTISASLQKRLLENGMPPRLLERIAGGGVKLDTGKEETA